MKPKIESNSRKLVFDELSLGACLDLLKDGTHSSFQDSPCGYPLLSAKDIDGEIKIPKDSRVISEKDYKAIYNSYELKANDVLLTIVGSVGRVAVVPKDVPKVAFQRSVAILRPKDFLDSSYFSYLLQSPKFCKSLNSRVKMGAQGGIYLKDLASIPVKFPELIEQQKIAAFFRALDEKIKLVENKLSKTHLLFEALIEKVLDKKLTFGDGVFASVPWQKVVLKDICKKISYGINAPAGDYNGCWKYIRITDIDERTHKFTQSLPVSADMDHDQKLLTKYKVQTGDILFARTGASVGKSYHYDQRDGNLIFAGFLIRCSLDLNKCNSYFIYLQTLTKRYSKWVKENSMRSGQPGLNSEQYGNFELVLPSLDEQHKIASFFKVFDEKMCNLSLQLEVLKKQKKAFMQQVFI